MIEWFAGLIDGEGCFTFAISKKHNSKSLQITQYFCICMSDGEWVPIVERFLIQNEIPFQLRDHLHAKEIRIKGNESVCKLCKIISPYCVVKKPIVDRFINHVQRCGRNQFTNPNIEDINRIANDVDFVRTFNRKKNIPYKWTGNMIREFYNVKITPVV